MADPKFVHLHVHSEYSLLDGLTKFGPLMDHVKENGMDAVALTDHGGMYGAIKFYNKAKAAGIKPIIGVETYIAKRTRFDKDPKLDSDQYHLILLAKSEKGYKNLLKIVTASYLEGYYYKPRVDFDLLTEYKEDIIALSGCLSGIGQAHWKKGEDEQAEKGMLKLHEIFQDNFYCEIQRHASIKELDIVNPKLIAFARKYGLPLVATADSHYLSRDDAEAQEILLCIQTQKTITDPNRGLSMISEPNFYIKSPQEMVELYADLPEAIENTIKIAEQVNIELDIGKLIFPKFPVPEGETSASFLRKLAFEKIPTRYSEITEEITKRLDYELTIIEDKGYPTYFLIIQDVVNWAKGQGIGVGPGRGSGAGSLTSYVLGITDLDPLFHKLPFERFLNPERASPPDIDMDFADDRREEVIQYVTQQYGVDHVAQIVTFGTMEARAAVRDCGRALGYSYTDCDRIAKLIPVGAQGSHMTVDHALELSPELKIAYDTEPTTKRLLDLSKKLAGVARHASVHAAGVVIGDKPLVEYTPLMRESKGDKIVTQYDMYSLDLNVADGAVGLMKMDFLGLRNLTILQNAVQFVKSQHGFTVELLKVPLDDPAVFEVLATGNTTGIFQIESPGMRRLIKELKPTLFSDISAILALYRPGPMDLIPSFIAGKQNPQIVKYPHPALKPILEETYGVTVFQEQCLEIAVQFAGYSMGTADLLRRAIGKKKKELMEIEKKKFIAGAQSMGYTKNDGETVFAFIEKFASYGFNKAHAACYALITYQTAYMKAHYPTEFMAAVLSAEANAKMGGTAKEEKIGNIVSESRRMGLAVLRPDINKSQAGFTIEDYDGTKGNIRFGLAAIKNVGEVGVDAFVVDRDINGEFTGLEDFLLRVDTEKANKRVLESLIKSGAFDDFGSRKELLFKLEQLLEIIHREKRLKNGSQTALFEPESMGSKSVRTIEIPNDLGEFSKLELLRFEKEFLGFVATSQSLFSDYKNAEDAITHSIADLAESLDGDGGVVLLGLITSIRKTLTKAAQAEMAFIKFEDDSGEIEMVVFPKTYDVIKERLIVNQPLIVVGKRDSRNDTPTVIVETVIDPLKTADDIASAIDSANAKRNASFDYKSRKIASPAKPKEVLETEAVVVSTSNAYELYIRRGTTKEMLETANELLKKFPGSVELTVVLENRQSIRKVKYPTPVACTPELKSQLEGLLGSGCLRGRLS